jgi:hypothetical protein
MGVYLDFGTSGIEAHRNVVKDASGVFGAFFVLGGQHNKFVDNRVVNSLVNSYRDYTQMDMDWFSGWPPLYPHDNVWSGNHCFDSSGLSERTCVELIHHGFNPNQ